MRRHLPIIAAAIMSLSMLIMPSMASAADESASTAKWPWSGYWWPYLDNGYNLYSSNGPLEKLDRFSGLPANAGAQMWERTYHYTNDKANTWWGHCQAWSAASILTAEPKALTRNGISFTVNDVKGMTTALYYEPTYHWLSGNRVDSANDTTSAAFKDIAPAWMDYLLRYYIRNYRYPFIMDINADAQVWNYPAFAYRRSSTANADGSESVSTTVWYSKPDWGVNGTTYFSRTYTYVLRSGTLGEWTGNSVLDHPDFAWVPTGKRIGSGTNPYVTEARVEAITGLDV